jgi:hypothetical protein
MRPSVSMRGDGMFALPPTKAGGTAIHGCLPGCGASRREGAGPDDRTRRLVAG